VSRSFHSTTTHFNGFFNARELVNEAVDANTLYPAMDKSIEKCSRAIDRHSMMIKKKQENEWIDDCYLLIGKSQFYKRSFGETEEVLKYVTKQFKKEPIRHEAKLWLARMNMEKGQFTKAETLLSELDEKRNDFPKGLEKDFRETYAHYYMLIEDYDTATDELKMAIELTSKKQERARQTFILAQLYAKMGKSQKAIARYADVAKMNPGYEMKFYALLNQALAFDSRADARSVREVMMKMLKDEKYVEFRDQIYYALAEVEFEERNVDEGIADLLLSTEVSVNNPKQKGKSFHRLAEIYLEEREYQSASAFYDSTITYLPKDYPDYEVIKNTKESLSELVHWIRIAEHEDSVQTLASMDDQERKKELRAIIKKKRDEENERIRLQQQEELDRIAAKNDVRADQQRNQTARGQGGNWYFYNENSKAIGYTEFQAKFGKRSLQDGWRRKDKSQIEFSEDGEVLAVDDTKAGSANAIPTMDDLLAGLPLTDEAVAASNDTIAHALFEIGRIYKDKLGDEENAIENFEDLNVRFEGNPYEQMAYYHLYRLFLAKEESGAYFPSDPRSTSAYYKELITGEFPNSEYARIISDPDYATSADQDKLDEIEGYEATYRLYRQRNYNDVMVACLDVMNNDPKNRLVAKYQLLRAMSIGNKKDRTNFIKALREIVQKFPGTEEEAEAKRLLGLLDVASLPTEAEMKAKEKADKAKNGKKEELTSADKEKGKNEKAGSKKDPVLGKGNSSAPKGEFVFKSNTDHYFAVVVPNQGNSITALKAKVSDFNLAYFKTEAFKTTNSFINAESQVLLVRTMGNKDEAMAYYTAFTANQDQLTGLNDQGFSTFVMSSKNFAEMFKKKDVSGYVTFFEENYLN